MSPGVFGAGVTLLCNRPQECQSGRVVSSLNRCHALLERTGNGGASNEEAKKGSNEPSSHRIPHLDYLNDSKPLGFKAVSETNAVAGESQWSLSHFVADHGHRNG